jgi:hypothetical protein
MQVFSHNVAAFSFGWANDNLDDIGTNLMLIKNLLYEGVLNMCKYISNIFGSYYQGHTAGSQW